MNDIDFLKAHDKQINLLFDALKYSNKLNTPENEKAVELNYINLIQEYLIVQNAQKIKSVQEYLNWVDCQLSKYIHEIKIREIKNYQDICHIGLGIANYVSYLNQEFVNMYCNSELIYKVGMANIQLMINCIKEEG